MKSCFNSRLVRLKAGCIYQGFSFFIKFQFQIGAIKGIRSLIPTMDKGQFQFQIGAIKGQGKHLLLFC